VGISRAADRDTAMRMINAYTDKLPNVRQMDEFECRLLGTPEFLDYFVGVIEDAPNYFTLPLPGTAAPKTVAMVVDVLIDNKFSVGEKPCPESESAGQELLNAHMKNLHKLASALGDQLHMVPAVSLDYTRTPSPQEYGAIAAYPLGYVPVRAHPRGHVDEMALLLGADPRLAYTGMPAATAAVDPVPRLHLADPAATPIPVGLVRVCVWLLSIPLLCHLTHA
jgi:hypothetical protein